MAPVLHLTAHRFHVMGPKIEKLFPRSLDIGHRMELKQLLEYIPQLERSTSRACTCMLLEKKYATSSDYDKLFEHLRTTERSGVVQVSPKEFPGALLSFFKEVYVFPLAAIDPDPEFLTVEGFER